MNNTRPKGKYRPKYSKPRSGILVPVLLILLGTLALILCAAIALRIWSGRKAENDFHDLAAMVTTLDTQPTHPSGEVPTDSTPVEAPPETTLPPETEPVLLEKYRSLYQENPDLAGWIKIEGTVIDYPVMYTPGDPEKYLHLDFYGNYSYAGIPFIDANCSMDSDNLLIYGHNMTNGTMFRSITRYEQKNYWLEHPTIVFDTLYEEQEYEVLAAFYDRVYYQNEDVFKFYRFIDAEDEEVFDHAVNILKSKSIYDTGVTASYGDQLITLVTCTYHVENGRFVLVARKK